MTTSNPLDRMTVIVAALALAGVGALFYNMLPLFLGVAQDFRQLSTGQIGILSAAFFLGYNVVAGSAFFWIRRISWRTISATATPIAVGGLAAMLVVDTYPSLLACAFIAGGALSALYGLSATVIGDTSNPTRWFGVKISWEAATGAILFLILPGTLIATHGFDGMVVGMLGAILVLIPLFFWIPARGVKTGVAEAITETQAVAAGGTSPRSNSAIWSSLGGCLLFFGGQTTIWAFVERIGANAGFDPAIVGTLLSVTLLFAVTGSLIAAALGSRFGNIPPFLCACALFIIALVLLAQAQQFAFYASGACLVMLSVGSGITFCVSEVATLDRDGRYIVLSVPAIGIGAMVGPAMAGFLWEAGGFLAVLVFGGVGVTIAALLFAFLLLGKRSVSSTAPVRAA